MTGAAAAPTEPETSRSAEVLTKARGGYAPPPRLTVSEFCDAELVVPTGPLGGTKWRTDFAPYQRGILDAFHAPGVEHVVVMGSSQWGKTSIALNLVAYHIAHDPCPILVVQPTVDPMAKDFSANRLDPLIKATPCLNDRVSKKRARNASNTVFLKTFRGGLLAIAGANSAASLAARSIRLLILDEIDRYPPELRGEGDTISIALKRTTAYRGRRRIMMASSPTERDNPIDTWFRRGDQRHYHIPCPACGAMHQLQWANVRWHDGDPKTARIHCPECDHGMDDAERVAQLADGEWVADNPTRRDRHVASFHMWEAYSPLSSLESIVAGFIQARKRQKEGDPLEMHTWQNTTLGEPVEPDAGEGVESHTIILRREAYPSPAPAGVCFVTMGTDVQDDRLEALVLGWGPGDECWLLDRHELPGDTNLPEPWQMHDELLAHQYLHESGQRLPIVATCMDTAGHRTAIAYEYCRRNVARRVFATIGRDGDRPIVSSPTRKKWGKVRRPVALYVVGVDTAKAELMNRLGITEPGPGYIHVPQATWADEELAAQLTSERVVTRRRSGVTVRRWVKVRPRNEMLDCYVLALAALRLLHPDLDLLAQRLAKPASDEPPPDRQPKGDRWIPRNRRGGWLRRGR